MSKKIISRIEEIKGWLNAYLNGWVSYDRAHVLQLKAELAKLETASSI